MNAARRPWSVLAPTVLCAVLMAVPVMLSFAPPPANAPRGSPTVAPLLDDLALLRAHLDQRQAAANEAFWASLANESLTSLGDILERAHAAHQLTNWTPTGVHLLAVEQEARWNLLGCSLSCYAGLALFGCAAGGVAGLFAAGPIGAGAGCVSGATVAIVVGIIAFGMASAGNNAAEINYIVATTVQFDNDLIYAQGFTLQTFSDLNSTFHAWASMADSAALAQLPNATFDPLWDLNVSGVGVQLATIVTNVRQAVDAAFYDLDQSIISVYSPGTQFASGCSYYIAFSSATLGCLASPPNSYWAHANAAIEGSAVTGAGATVAAGGFFYAYCSQDTFVNQVTTNTTGETRRQVHAAQNVPTLVSQTANYEATYRFVIAAAGSCDLLGSGYTMVPAIATSNPTDQISLVVCGFKVIALSCNPTNVSASGWGKFNFPFTFGAKVLPGGGAITAVYQAQSTFAAFSAELNSLMNSATTEARTYWTFLHLLGYTNVNQIPSNCIIPTPNQVLPPQYTTNIGTLTLNQSLSLYEAWLNGLATFFNVNQTALTFCGGHSVFQVGFTPWNLNVITTGFVFTQPRLNQLFGTMSTWTVTNATQTKLLVGNGTRLGLRTDPAPIVLWATVVTMNLKVGRIQEIPVNDPIDVFSPNNGTLYLLNGNGTAVNGQGWSNTTVTTSMGAAIYLSSCSVLNPATGTYQTANQGICPLQLSSIQNVSFPTVTQPPPVVLTSSNCGQTGFFGTIVQAWDGVVNGLPFGLACPVAIILGVVTLVVLVVIVLYIAVKAGGAVLARREE